VGRERLSVPDRVRVLLAAAALVALVLVVFLPVRQHDFVDYDDLDFIVNDSHVNQGLTADSVRWAFAPANAYTFTGGPLTWLSHMLDFELFGRAPGPQHVVNLLLHALNSVLLLLVLWRMTGAVTRSAVVAALFAIHPLHVESVAWISERKDVLSTLFWLLTTAAYVRYVQRPGAARYLTVFVLLTLGLLAKPALVTLPFTLLLLDFWPLARAPLAWTERRRWFSLLLEKLPLLVPAAGVMMLTLVAQERLGAVSSAGALPWMLRVATAVVSYATYLGKMLWPANLAVFYPYPARTSVWPLVLSIVVFSGLSIAAWLVRHSRPYITFGWLWYVVTLIPMIGLVQVGSHSMADRYTYVPLIGVFVALVWGVSDLLRAQVRRPAVAIALASATILTCAVVARAQVSTWQNSETMWSHALAVTTGNFRAYAGMAEVAASRGEIDVAISHYQQALALAPDAADWQVNAGLLLQQRGRFEDAASAFLRAVQLRPADAESHNNLGAMLVHLGRAPAAIEHYQRALALKPAYALARRNLGLALAGQGDVQGGLRECLEALRLSPAEGPWHYEAALMLLNLGRTDDAVAHLKQTVSLQPQHQAARELLATLR
jgi:Tfp pilus assembly protein PilF